MTFARAFTRPLLMQITDHSAAFVAILADRAEDDPTLARHILAALHDLRAACDLDTTGASRAGHPAKVKPTPRRRRGALGYSERAASGGYSSTASPSVQPRLSKCKN